MQALRVLNENSSHLVVSQNSALTSQGIFWMLFPWIVGGLCLWGAWRLGKSQVTGRVISIAIIGIALFSLFFDFVGGMRFFIKHSLTLSRDSEQVISQEFWFGKLADQTVYDLNAVQYAQVEFGRGGTKRVVLVMKDDSVVVPLRSVYSDEEGHYAVVNAINRFLGVQNVPLGEGARDR